MDKKSFCRTVYYLVKYLPVSYGLELPILIKCIGWGNMQNDSVEFQMWNEGIEMWEICDTSMSYLISTCERRQLNMDEVGLFKPNVVCFDT